MNWRRLRSTIPYLLLGWAGAQLLNLAAGIWSWRSAVFGAVLGLLFVVPTVLAYDRVVHGAWFPKK